MANRVFNVAKGRVNELAALAGANDALILVLLKTAGLESDDTLQDAATLAAVVAGTTDEADFGGYTRRTLTGVTVTIDNTGNLQLSNATNPTAYTATGASQAVSRAVVCWDGDTTAGTDANIVPLVLLDCVVTFDVGVATTLSFAAGGFFSAS